MYKTIAIHPINETIYNQARNVEIKNEFLKLGVTKRKDFVTTCRDHNDFFKEWTMHQSLVFFWTGQSSKNAEMINQVQIALDNYKQTLPAEQLVKNLSKDGKY